MLILHGENQVESRQNLLSVKQAKSTLELSGSSLTLDQLVQSVETNSLFGQANTVVIESVFSQRASASKKKIIDYLEKSSSKDIIIWEPKDVTSQLKGFDQKLVKKFDFPKHIFKFLDFPSLSALHLALSITPPEVVFASLITRAHKQVKTIWLQELITIDYQLKTGQLPYDLATALELWVAKI